MWKGLTASPGERRMRCRESCSLVFTTHKLASSTEPSLPTGHTVSRRGRASHQDPDCPHNSSRCDFDSKKRGDRLSYDFVRCRKGVTARFPVQSLSPFPSDDRSTLSRWLAGRVVFLMEQNPSEHQALIERARKVVLKLCHFSFPNPAMPG